MTLFSSRYMSMSGELKSSRSRAASKRASNTIYGSEFDLDYDSYHEDYNDRVYDYQRVPASLSPLPLGPSLAKRSRSSSYSSGNRRSRDRTHSKSSRAHSTSSSTTKWSPLREDSPAGSLYALSASSPEHSLSSLSPPSSRHRIHRENPDPREPNDEHHTMSNYSSDLEEEI
ncbi:heterogeneous nuclear ribonucleoprotein C-like isoform X2 [Clinocottus analis]|uniref:heterogeneous nuclear ribonucleoprotein C-like isoform X2 n=1 Tax=Clinocottus analis TaxID=304258 RepID=UPI0035C23F28